MTANNRTRNTSKYMAACPRDNPAAIISWSLQQSPHDAPRQWSSCCRQRTETTPTRAHKEMLWSALTADYDTLLTAIIRQGEAVLRAAAAASLHTLILEFASSCKPHFPIHFAYHAATRYYCLRGACTDSAESDPAPSAQGVAARDARGHQGASAHTRARGADALVDGVLLVVVPKQHRPPGDQRDRGAQRRDVLRGGGLPVPLQLASAHERQ
ncbi:hypothetical protein GQ600_25317 [Phytophthora cactorum]|nr:hypothetical protein GQ600_25317 [Phytophthora cactorum]